MFIIFTLMKNLLIFLFLITTTSLLAQLNIGGIPYGFSNNLNTNIPTVSCKSVNLQPLIAEDAVTDKHKDIPWRFGVAIPVNISTKTNGIWTTLSNGDRLWQLAISSKNAKSLNLNYNHFYLPKGALFYIYNRNKTQVLGAFTHLNNRVNKQFATSLIYDDEIILEYFEPNKVKGRGIIQINSVVHGYRTISYNKAFGSSGSCNVNAICDTTLWGDEIRSAVMLLTAGNTRFCSGALVNNVKEDKKPFILTANHCGVSTNNIFMFNYQSDSCVNTVDGPTNNTLQGCIIRANYAPSDVTLVELIDTIPNSFNAFFAGWSALNVPATKSTGIHFPSGDVKKISHDVNSVIESGYYSGGTDHWQVLDWDAGTTEGGSSGSPLFNQNHRIVGQLHGGDAACNNDLQDYYGKFAVSWNTSQDTSQQLKYWLDPDSTGAVLLDGMDPLGSKYQTDAMLLGIDSLPLEICGKDSISPILAIKNKGNDTLTFLEIYYKLDANAYQYIQWNGNLPPYKTIQIQLSTMYVGGGSHSFTAYTINPNQVNDQNSLNDTLTYTFTSNNQPHMVNFKIITDKYGNELTWKIRDRYNNPLLSGGPYQVINGGDTIYDSFCLYDECFTFTLYDSFGDGYCCTYGNGSYLLTDALNGDTLGYDNTFNSDSISSTFCLGDSCTIFVSGSVQTASFGLNDGNVFTNISGGSGHYSFNWSNGSTTKDLFNVGQGTYTLTVYDSITGCSVNETFIVDQLNGVENYSNSLNITVYPNPNTGKFIVSSTDTIDKIEVYNIIGKLIKIEKPQKTSSYMLTINTAGVYIVNVNSEDKSEVIKVLVK